MHNFLSRTSASLLQCSITLLHITTRTRKMQEHSHPSTSRQNKRCDKSGTEKGKRMRVQEGALHVRILPSTVSLPDFANHLQCSIALHAIQCKKRTARPLHPRILTLHLFARQTVLQPPARRDGGSCKSKGQPSKSNIHAHLSLSDIRKSAAVLVNPAHRRVRKENARAFPPLSLPASRTNDVTKVERTRESACEYNRKPSTFGSIDPRYLSRTSADRLSSAQKRQQGRSTHPHLNAPSFRTTNGVTTTGLKRRRIMQEQETALHQLSLSDIRKPAAALNNPVAHHRTHEEKCKSSPTPLTASKKNDVTSLGIEKCNRTQNIFLTNNSKLGRIQGSNPVFKRECKPR